MFAEINEDTHAEKETHFRQKRKAEKSGDTSNALGAFIQFAHRNFIFVCEIFVDCLSFSLFSLVIDTIE